jgi:hypothetical protein
MAKQQEAAMFQGSCRRGKRRWTKGNNTDYAKWRGPLVKAALSHVGQRGEAGKESRSAKRGAAEVSPTALLVIYSPRRSAPRYLLIARFVHSPWMDGISA